MGVSDILVTKAHLGCWMLASTRCTVAAYTCVLPVSWSHLVTLGFSEYQAHEDGDDAPNPALLQ